MDKVIVVKIGGATFTGGDTTIADLVTLQHEGKPVVVVHGGGNRVTGWLKRLGVATHFVHGERVTDRAVLEVVIAVLGGLVNKEIVAAINNSGGRAVGISGVDGGLLHGRVKDRALGYVAEVVRVNPEPVKTLLQASCIPVIAPVTLNSSDRMADAPPILNINGDHVAGELAVALAAGRLIFLTDVAGVCDQSGGLLPRLSADEAEALIASGVASGGMVPKIRACLRALSVNSAARIIDGRQPHALLREMAGQGGGTTIYH